MTPLHAVPEVQLTVLIACGESLLRAGYRALLEGRPRIAVTGDASPVREAVELARKLRPDAVLMDIEISDFGLHRGDQQAVRRSRGAGDAAGCPRRRRADLRRTARRSTGVLSKDTAPDG